MPAKDMHKLCSDLRGVSDYLQITLSGTRIHLSVNCEEAEGWVQFYLTKGQNGVKIKTYRRVNLELNLKFLRKIMKAANVSEKLYLRMDQDNPAKFEFPIKSAELSYFLAPAIE